MTQRLFTMTDIQWSWPEHLTDGTEVLLQGQPFSDDVQVFIKLGRLNKSEDLATTIGAYPHGRRWGKITRNDGHYIEVTVEEHEDDKDTASKTN